MGLITIIQELIGISGHGEIAAETGVFQLPAWYVTLKAVVAFAMGMFLIWIGVAPPFALAPWERAIVFLIGLGGLGVGASVARSAKRIAVANGLVTAEFMGGRRESWPVRDLDVQAPTGLGLAGGAVVVRVRSTGRVAFVIPRDMPAWEVLASSFPSSNAA